jgi:hypothetical protein
MAFVKISLTNEAWTLIGNNVTRITFQNGGQFPIYINFTAANTAPTDTVGLIYGAREGEMYKLLTEMTSVPLPKFVWARSTVRIGNVIVEQ